MYLFRVDYVGGVRRRQIVHSILPILFPFYAIHPHALVLLMFPWLFLSVAVPPHVYDDVTKSKKSICDV